MSSHSSIWVETSPATRFPPLKVEAEVEVAVLGGGIVGLTTAWRLQQAGLRVAVLEADRVARGVTASSTAKVTALHGTRYQQLVREHGEEKAAIYAEANTAALETLASLVAEEGIDCGLERVPAYTFAEDVEQARAVEREIDALRRAFLKPVACSEVPLPFPTFGAVRLDDQIQFHPGRYLVALASLLEERACPVYEYTRALAVEGTGPYVVAVDGGSVRARHVVVATHIPILDRGLFFARAWPSRSYGLAARVEPGALVDGMYLNAGSPSHSVRSAVVDGKEWLILVGYGHKVGDADPVEQAEKLEEWGRSHFELKAVGWRWSTQDYVSNDHLPFVGPAVPGQDGVLVATGFGGWGLSNGIAAANALADRILDRPNLAVGLFDPARLNLEGVATSLKEGLRAAIHFVEDRVVVPGDEGELDAGEGRVVRRGGKSVAQYRDMAGTLHERSATCTHTGCVVGWNGLDQTWDCPCHGSRYDALGKVLHGPTVRDLDKLQGPDRGGFRLGS